MKRKQRTRGYGDVPPTPSKEWTILVFMVPDARLEQPARDDIAEMTQVDSLDDLHVVVQVDHQRKPERFVIGIGQAEPLPSPHALSLTRSLEQFITWGVSQYPAKHYALILWGHGQGVGTRLSRPAPLAEANGELSGTDFRAGLRGLGLPIAGSFETLSSFAGSYLGPPPVIVNIGRGSSNGSTEFLDVLDVAKAIKAANLRQKLDILGFDACFMSGVEVAYQLKDAARMLVASQDFVPDEGWDYQSFLNIVTSHSLECGCVARSILAHVEDRGGLTNLSVVDLTEAQRLADGLAALVTALKTSVARNAGERLRVQMLCEQAASLRIRQMIDLYDLCHRLDEDFGETAADDPLDARVRDAAKALMKTLEETVQYRAEGLANKLNGLSIMYENVEAGFSLPGDPGPPELNVEIDRAEYQSLGLIGLTGWLALMESLTPAA